MGEGLDVLCDWRVGETASVRVGGERAAETQPVGPCLFLHDAPLARVSLLTLDERRHERGPLDARPNLHLSAAGVEVEDRVHAARVHVHRVGTELLAAHRVPPAGDRHGAPLAGGAPHEIGERLSVRRPLDANHSRPVELRMNVVHPDAVGARFVLRQPGARAGPERGGGSGTRRAHEQFHAASAWKPSVDFSRPRLAANTSASATAWAT